MTAYTNYDHFRLLNGNCKCFDTELVTENQGVYISFNQFIYNLPLLETLTLSLKVMTYA